MGNSQLDTKLFPNSNKKWVQDQNAATLYCPQLNLQSDFEFKEQLAYEDTKFYIFRTLHQNCLVNINSILTKQQIQEYEIPTLGAKDRDSIRYAVLVQKIGYRLTDLGAINFADGSYILRQGIAAIKVLLTVFDNFVVEQEAVGFNNNGECKLWVNSNYFKNNVQNCISQQQTTNQVDSFNTQCNITNPKQNFRNKHQQPCCISRSSSLQNIINIVPKQVAGHKHQAKNAELILSNFLTLLQDRMMHKMTKRQENNYSQIKKRCLAQTSIQQLQPSLSRNCSQNNDKCNKKAEEKDYSYTLYNMEKFANQLCQFAKVGPKYVIAVPELSQPKNKYQSANLTSLPTATTLTLGKPNVTQNLKKVSSASEFIEQQQRNSKFVGGQKSPAKVGESKSYKLVANNKMSLKKQAKARVIKTSLNQSKTNINGPYNHISVNERQKIQKMESISSLRFDINEEIRKMSSKPTLDTKTGHKTSPSLQSAQFPQLQIQKSTSQKANAAKTYNNPNQNTNPQCFPITKYIESQLKQTQGKLNIHNPQQQQQQYCIPKLPVKANSTTKANSRINIKASQEQSEKGNNPKVNHDAYQNSQPYQSSNTVSNRMSSNSIEAAHINFQLNSNNCNSEATRVPYDIHGFPFCSPTQNVQFPSIQYVQNAVCIRQIRKTMQSKPSFIL